MKVSEYVGALNTILLIVLTAIIGSLLIKREGIKTINQIKTIALNNPEHLFKVLGEGFFLVISGILLLTPGFITDVVGIVLFIKKPRHIILDFLLRRIKSAFH